MASFHAGKLARHKSGRFVKSFVGKVTENLNAGSKRKLSESARSVKPSVFSESLYEREFPVIGRRIVELSLLAKELDGGCTSCRKPLRLSDCREETISGLGSVLYITCGEEDCGEVNVCHTSKMHRVTGTRGRPVFDINTKLAAGK